MEILSILSLLLLLLNKEAQATEEQPLAQAAGHTANTTAQVISWFEWVLSIQIF